MPRFTALAALFLLVAAPACAEPPSAEAPALVTKVFQLPAGSRPHDAAPAPDGRIWYTA